jgi:hypothetical protein
VSAVISACGKYRYSLTRGGVERLLFVMLNPSTADASVDDATIRRCMGFAFREHYSGIEVMNLYAYRATDPRELRACLDPVGPDNDGHLIDTLSRHQLVVVAWGTHAKRSRVEAIRFLLEGSGVAVKCLGRTKDGHPKHPLYLRGDAPLERWP